MISNTMRCPHCNLVQFEAVRCRKCRREIKPPKPEPVPALEAWDGNWGARIGARMKIARAKKGLSQAALGKLVGVRRSYISKIERGRLTPYDPMRLASALDVPVYYLLMGDHEFRSQELLADPFIAELAEAGHGLAAYDWKAVVDYAETLISQKVFKGRR
jgi:transcriptional regulator with XRE-family HTH domain